MVSQTLELVIKQSYGGESVFAGVHHPAGWGVGRVNHVSCPGVAHHLQVRPVRWGTVGMVVCVPLRVHLLVVFSNDSQNLGSVLPCL